MRGRRNGGRRERSKEGAKNVRLWLMQWIEKNRNTPFSSIL
jgi:hypothetical protein